jgi:hypothetical protein
MVSNIDDKIQLHRAATGEQTTAKPACGATHRFASILTHASGRQMESTSAVESLDDSTDETAPARTSLTATAPAGTPATATPASTVAAVERSPLAQETTPSEPAPTDPNAPVTTVGTLSTDPRTAGMYVPPDFYHGGSYSPVFENADGTPKPRFDGQKIYSNWRASAPADWDPNARVVHDQLNWKQGANWWKQDASGNWVRRPEGYGGIPLNDDGTPIFTPDPTQYPEYYKV